MTATPTVPPQPFTSAASFLIASRIGPASSDTRGRAGASALGGFRLRRRRGRGGRGDLGARRGGEREEHEAGEHGTKSAALVHESFLQRPGRDGASDEAAGGLSLCGKRQTLLGSKSNSQLPSGPEKTVALRTSTSHLTLGLSISMLLVACGGAQPKQAGDDSSWEKQPTKSSTDESSGATSASSGDSGEDTKWTGPSEPAKLNEEQIGQMTVALKRGQSKAANCATVVENGPTGEGPVSVTFDGKIGKITDVEVGAPFAGTPVEQCIKRSFIGEYCLPFEG